MAPRYSEPVTFDSGLVALAFRGLREPGSRYPFLERLIRRRRQGGIRVGGVIVAQKVLRGQRVVVVRRGETELFETLKREFGHVPDIQVIWDRRSGDRRTRRGDAPTAERRQRDRRARPPAMWEIEGYLFVRSDRTKGGERKR
jgi:hypothetical protein